MRAAAILVALVLALAAIPATAQSNVTYFLHATGECSQDNLVTFVDQSNSGNDQDGCGAVGTAGPTGEGFEVEYDGRAPLNASLPQGQAATAHIFVSTEQPDQVSVDVYFVAGNATCAGSSEVKQLTNTPIEVVYTDFAVPCAFSAPAGPDVVPTLVITVHASVAYFLGYEGNHASRVDLGALQAPAPTNATGNGTQPPESKSPGPLVVGSMLALALAVAWARRRREA